MNELILLGLEASAIGLSGVFAVLILFYILTKLLMFTFRPKVKKEIPEIKAA